LITDRSATIAATIVGFGPAFRTSQGLYNDIWNMSAAEASRLLQSKSRRCRLLSSPKNGTVKILKNRHSKTIEHRKTRFSLTLSAMHELFNGI